MKRAHVWLIATCVAIPIFLAAENTPTKAPAAPPVAKPPEQESLKPADVKELPAPVYHCDGCGTKGYPGPRCEQKVLDAEKTIGYPTTPVGGHGCTHWVWKVLSTSGDWNHARYVDAKGWETLALDKKKAKLQEIGAYLDEVDEAYGKVWKQANLIIGVYQKGASLSGAVASQPNAKVYAPRQVQCKAFSEGGLWVPESTSPGPRFATYQERINYLQTKLTPLELKGGQSADDLKKDFDATAKALDLRDIVLGKQLREMGDYVDKARGAVQKLCAAPASEGSKLADQKLNVKDIESMRKTVDQVGKEAMEAALFNSEAGSKLSPEEKAGVKASMQELVVIYDPKDHKPMFVQHLVAKGKDGKEVESYKTFHVDEGGADTVTKLVQQLASQIQKDDSLWGSMKATVGVIAADPVAAAKDTAKNLKDWFPPASGDSKAALERRYAAAESDAGSQALAKLNKTRAGLKTWDQKAEQACNEQWRKYDIEDAMIDKLKTAEDTKPRDPKAPAPDTAYQRAKNVLEAARKQYSAAGPDGKPVLCKDKGNSGLGEAMDARWSDAVVAENAKLGGVRAESAASSERLEDSELAKTRLRREYLRQMLISKGDYFNDYVAQGNASVRADLGKQLAWTTSEGTKKDWVDQYFQTNWPGADGSFYLNGWQYLPRMTNAATLKQYVATERLGDPHYRAPCDLETSFIRQMAGLFPAWGHEWWRVWGGQAPDEGVLKYVKPFVLKDFAGFRPGTPKVDRQQGQPREPKYFEPGAPAS